MDRLDESVRPSRPGESDESNELVKVEHLTKRYDGFTLDDVSLSVGAGRVVGLIGSNGAGKTTLLKAMLGLIAPDAGTVTIFGRSARAASKAIDLAKERIGIVFDTCAFLPWMRIKDVASLGRAAYSNWDEESFSALCARFRLDAKKRVKDISRGMGMKLTLAFALSHHPELLILDEATAGLDPIARDEILDILREFMNDEGHGILMATHITTDLEKIADEIICIDDGDILFSLPKEAICDEAGIAHCRTSDIEKMRLHRCDACERAKVLQRGLGIDVLVPDRFAFSTAFPDISVEHASVEDYMTLTMKGERL